MSPRSYQSPRRESAAAETRAAILSAAVDLFERHGYAATTVAAVAAQADVSVNTVYASVGGKSQLLVRLIEEAAGDGRIDRAMADVRAATGPQEVLKVLAEGVLDSFRSHSWLLGTLYEMTGADPLLADAAGAAEHAYSSRLAEVAARIDALGALRPGVSREDAADLLWFYFGLRAWKDLRSRGWGWERIAPWLVAQAAQAVLADGPNGSSARGDAVVRDDSGVAGLSP